MENLIWILPVLACPLMMIAMMWMMGKGMGMGRKRESEAEQPSLDELRDEQERLAAEIEERQSGNGRATASRARSS